MEDKQLKKNKNSFHLRVYDAELLKSLNELLATDKYESMNELLNCALGVGVEKIYLEFGKRKLFTRAREIPEVPEGKRLDKIEFRLEKQRIMQEDMFILMNSIEALVASIFNVQRAEINGEAVSGELIDSGIMAKLPPAYLEIKDNLIARFNRKGRINPLHVYPVLTDEGDIAPPEVVFNAHLQFLEDFFKITLKGIAQDAFEELNNLIKLTYESVGIKHDTDCTDFKPEQYPTFDTLKEIVEKEMQRTNLTPMRKTNLERVNSYIQKFATDGMYSSLWNGPSTLEVDSRFVVFNFQSLFGAKNQTVANAQILVVMRYLDMQIINIRELNRNGYGDVVHPLIVLDEGYNFIDADYPVALQFAYLWYKRIRKYEGSIFFLTQNLSDIFGNEKVIQKTSAIVNNSQYSFVFGLAPADLEILTDLYKNVGGLNPTERAFISDAGNGDCFAICSARQRTRFHVEAHDTVRAIFENVGKPWEGSE